MNKKKSKPNSIAFMSTIFCIIFLLTIIIKFYNINKHEYLRDKSSLLMTLQPGTNFYAWLSENEFIISNSDVMYVKILQKGQFEVHSNFLLASSYRSKYMKSGNQEYYQKKRWDEDMYSAREVATSYFKSKISHKYKLDDSVPSSDRQKVIWVCHSHSYNAFELLKSKFKPYVQSRATRIITLWVSDYNGHNPLMLGCLEVIPTKLNPYPWFGNVKWIPDTNKISYVYDDRLYSFSLN